MKAQRIITLPDGYTGKTVQFDLDPIAFEDCFVRLRCVSPGMEWIELWFHIFHICRYCKLNREGKFQ